MRANLGVVVIVEDDAGMRKSIERLLQAHDYSTRAFASAEEYRRATTLDDVIALVLDIHLDGMSGIELQRRLLAAGSKIPVVFITAHDSEAIRAEALAAGCVEYLQKPFDADRLTKALERCQSS